MELIDDIDKKILSYLIKDAKASYNYIAQKIGVSNVAVYKRVDKLKERKVITGSSVNINLKTLGYNTCAFIGIHY